MQYKSIAFLAAVASAMPTPDSTTVSSGDKYGLIAIRSGSAIQNVGVTAGKGGFSIGGTNEASCDKESNFATFDIDADGNAYLYSTDAPYQQLWVDRSGMGQGVWGYTTGDQPQPRNGERSPWSVNADGHFVFDGKSPQACPPYNGTGGWSVWWSDLEKPGYNENCTGIALRAIKSDDPVSCLYSEGS